jgi:hypothetical protein
MSPSIIKVGFFALLDIRAGAVLVSVYGRFASATPTPEARTTRFCLAMRIILSHGRVNVFSLATNAGTSVEQIERFYAKNLPLSKEMFRSADCFRCL